MPAPSDLYGFAQGVVREAAAFLEAMPHERGSAIVEELLRARETKFVADVALNTFILEGLAATGLPVVSEESPPPSAGDLTGEYWILDPLDGSVNFARGSGPCGISLALWQGSQPLLGVVYRVDTGELYAGGPQYPSTKDGRLVGVSSVATQEKATLATGFPARLDVAGIADPAGLLGDWARFAKVRMLGSASVSLCLVAEGALDAYFEQSIMLWDVAAGLSVVAGAGGEYSIVGDLTKPLQVEGGNGFASNWFGLDS